MAHAPVYLDYHATTPVDPRVLREMLPFFSDAFGNPAMHPTKTMKRAEFPADANLKVGERFTAKGVNGGLDVVLQIEEAGKDDVKVRLVHPLADKDLKYAIEVVQVRDPRPPPMPAKALKLEEES